LFCQSIRETQYKTGIGLGAFGLFLGEFLFHVEGRSPIPGQVGRDLPDASEGLGIDAQALGSHCLCKGISHVVQAGIFRPQRSEESFQREFHDLLRAAHSQVPVLALNGPSELFLKQVGFGKQFPGGLVVVQSSITSPGFQSGFRSQCQVPSG